ncbi:hypothetical protein [Mycoplasma todarodis]|uniref:Uncharacterized protein n=1 Tax=Mycoplasma todarodis TaxID=1937191 RepID=A0A4R0XVK9_9MOLU|nr:hypothetical protein [Mycoplasma todarodis]TCG11803.1 hypothetical protein C4B25_00575 [Mycoplasma todarodis]
MKNMSTKKKVSVVLSIVAAILTVIALIISVVFVAVAGSTIHTQTQNYSVNQKTIMWIADLGKPFFGSSTEIAILGIALSFISLIAITIPWIVILVRKKRKSISFNGSKIVIGISAVTAVTAITGMGLASVATVDFVKNTNMKNVSTYFEENAVKISEDREEAAKAGLLYVLANKDDLAAFSEASTVQMSIASTVFAVVQKEIKEKNSKILGELKEFSKKNPNIYEPVKGKFLGNLIKGTAKESAAEVWIKNLPSWTDLMQESKKIVHGANILVNNDAYMNLVSGDYPEIHKLIKKTFDNNEALASIPYAAYPPKTQKILGQLGFFKEDKDGKVKEGVFEWTTKLGLSATKFEKRVLGTIAKMFKLPYKTHEDQVKSRITLLEWLNTIINGIDYISKDETLKIQKDFNNIQGDYITATPDKIYMPTTKQDGTFSLEKKDQMLMGEVGDNTYDIKLNMMKYILSNLTKDKGGIFDALHARQANMTSLSFIEHMLQSKGLKAMVNQYPSMNKYFDNKNKYIETKEAKSLAKKIENFVK